MRTLYSLPCIFAIYLKRLTVNNVNSNGNERVTKCQLSGICRGCISGHSKPARQGSDLGLKDQAVINEWKANKDSRGCWAKTAKAHPRDGDQQAQAGQRTLVGVEQIGARWEVGLEVPGREGEDKHTGP